MRFALGPTDGTLLALSMPLLGLPGVCFVGAAWMPAQMDLLGVIGSLLVMAYASIWLFLRPAELEVTSRHLIIVFPLRGMEIPNERITSVQWYPQNSFAARFGQPRLLWVFGLWGGAGTLSLNDQTYEVYASRPTDLVVIEREGMEPLVLSPDRPEAFVSALVRQLPAHQANAS